MKKLAAIVLVLLLLAIIPVTIFLVRQGQEVRTKAAPATILSFSPSVLAVSKDETFDIFVSVNTGENLALGVDLKISFDTTKLEALSIEKADFFQNPQILANNIDNDLGMITYSIGSFTGSQGSGNIAKISFKAVNSGTASLAFAQGTAAAAADEYDILQRTIPATVNISGTSSAGIGGADNLASSALTPAPTVSNLGGLEATSTPTPTLGPTSTPTLVASPTPTATLVPTEAVQDIPVTGISTPTILFLSLGSLLILFFFVLV